MLVSNDIGIDLGTASILVYIKGKGVVLKLSLIHISSIRIGIQQRRAISIAPELLKRFMEEYPDVEIIFRDGNQEELAAMYREGTVDFVVTMYRDELADVTYRELAKEQVLVALPADHPANAYAYQAVSYTHLDVYKRQAWYGHLLHCELPGNQKPRRASFHKPV